MNKADQDKIINICRHNDISMIGIFGSTARGEATESSDIDLFVKLSKPKSLLSLVRLERNLSEALGKKVDLLTEGAISPYLSPSLPNSRGARRIFGQIELCHHHNLLNLLG